MGIDLAPSMAANAAADSVAILSGLLNPQADEVSAVYARNGYNEVQRDVIGDWTTLTLRR